MDLTDASVNDSISIDLLNQSDLRLTTENESGRTSSIVSNNRLKVILFTISCSKIMMDDKKEELTKLFETITELFDQFIDTVHQNDIVFAFNIHNDGQKMKYSQSE